jgi:hypothetical protein
MDLYAPSAVEEATCRASHRRDHEHGALTPECRPHAVEVVHLGTRAFAICHDCRTDSGYMAEQGARRAASEHRAQTAVRSAHLPRSRPNT